MNIQFYIFLLSLVSILLASTIQCGGANDSNDDAILALALLSAGSGYVDSCDLRASADFCQDNYGAGISESGCQSVNASAVYRTTPCPTENAIGSCKSVNGGTTVIQIFYTGASNPEGSCNGVGGTYSTEIQGP